MKSVKINQRYAFFRDLVRVINDHKAMSIACGLTSSQYRRTFEGVSDLSMYGAAFLNVAMMNCGGAVAGEYEGLTKYVLDDGNPYKDHVRQAYEHLTRYREDYGRTLGPLAFDSDDVSSTLQAADVVSWAVRRRDMQKLTNGFEPLADLLDPAGHIEHHYDETTMTKVAEDLRRRA